MSYVYNIETSKKDKCSTISLTTCHMIYNVVNLFLSTFLIAHIYSITSDLYSYAINVGIFQIATYFTMMIGYYLCSFWVDKSNRVIVYRVGNIVTAALVVVTVFYGKDLAKILWLAGILNGLAQSAYWSSFNVLKQEMVSRNSMETFAVVITVVGKVVNIVCPILLGMLIDISTFSMVAIYVLILTLILITISFFIKAKRPDNSSFKLFHFLKNLKQNSNFHKKLKMLYLICVFYGFSILLGNMINMNIMMQFGSNFSLGAITSVFSLIAVVILILMNRFTKLGKRFWLFVFSGIVPLISGIVFAVVPNMITLIIYNLCQVVCDVVIGTSFDIYRNKNLKEAGYYQDIAEHQCVVELIFQMLRIITFGCLIFVGVIKSYVLFYILFVVSIFAYTIVAFLLVKYEKVQNNKF